MGYHKESYRRIRSEYETKPFRAQAEAEARREEVYFKIPALREMDHRLSQVGLQVMNAALHSGNVDEEIARLRRENERINQERAALLAANGYPADYTEPHYECTLCNDSGFVGIKMCVCMKRQLAQASMELSGLSALIKKQSFENFSLDYYKKNTDEYRVMEHNYRTVRRWAEQFELTESIESRPPSLLFLGGTGLGKTHLSTSVAKVVIERGYDVFYNTAVGMMADFQQRRFGTSTVPAESENVPRYTECDLLIIDDLGTEVINQLTLSTLYTVIELRLNQSKPTIISTNLTSAELRKAYNDRITSRLMGQFLVLPFYGTDVRQQKIMS